MKRFLSALERMKRNLHTIVGDTKGLPQITSALQVWDDIFAAAKKVHSEIDYIDFETVEISQTRVTLVMILPTVEASSILEGALKKVEFLAAMELEVGRATPFGDKQKISFNYKSTRKR